MRLGTTRFFSWDQTLQGGFPGEDFGCRYDAEPVIFADECNPKHGLALAAATNSAAVVGFAEAAKDFGLGLLTGLVDLANLTLETVDNGVSELAVQLGIANEVREVEVERIREQIAFELENYQKRLDQVANALRGLPGVAAAFLDYTRCGGSSCSGNARSLSAL